MARMPRKHPSSDDVFTLVGLSDPQSIKRDLRNYYFHTDQKDYTLVNSTRTALKWISQQVLVAEPHIVVYKSLSNIPDKTVSINVRDVARILQQHIVSGELLEQICSIIESLDKTENLVNQIPNKAPELWVDRTSQDKTPGHFINRVYGEWIGQGFHTGHVRSLDGGLETAYQKWIDDGFPDAPEGFHLPTKHEAMGDEPTPKPGTIEARRHAEKIKKRRQREAKSVADR